MEYKTTIGTLCIIDSGHIIHRIRTTYYGRQLTGWADYKNIEQIKWEWKRYKRHTLAKRLIQKMREEERAESIHIKYR